MCKKLILLLAITWASASLTACATQSFLQCATPFLQPTVVDGKYATTQDVMRDPQSTTRDLADHSGQADDALARSNDDKKSALNCLGDKR